MPTGNSNVKRCTLRRITKLLPPVDGLSSSSTRTKLEHEFGSLYGSAYEAEVQCDGRAEEMNQLKQSLQQLANNETSTMEGLGCVEDEFDGQLVIMEDKLRSTGNDISERLDQEAHNEGSLSSCARAFHKLLADNLLYLTGHVSRTPYELGPLDDESLPLLQFLLCLNRLRFFSTCSQPSEDVFTSKYTPLLRHDQQKGFVDGFIEKGRISERIIQRLQELHPHYFMTAVDMATSTVVTTFPQSICVTRASACIEGEARWKEFTWHGGVKGFYETIVNFDSHSRQIFATCYGITLCSSTYGDGCAVKQLLCIVEEENR